MKFLQSLFHWDSSASVFEKAMTVLSVLFGSTLVIYLLLASFGVGNSYVAQAAHEAKGTKVLGFLLLAGTVFWAYINFSERIPFKVNGMAFILSLVVLLILIVNVNCGFRFNFG